MRSRRGSGVLRTTDGGTTWRREDLPFEVGDGASFGGIAVSFDRADHAIIVTSTGPIVSWSGESTLAAPRFLRPLDHDPKPVDEVIVEWTPVDGATEYRVQVSAQSVDEWFWDPAIWKEPMLDTTLFATTLALRELQYWHRYFVRVQAINATQKSTWYAPMGSSLFFTGKSGVAAPPRILSPADGGENVAIPVPIVWESVPGAIAYDLEVARDRYFTTSLFRDSTLTDTTCMVAEVDHNGWYFVRVRAIYESGPGDWSSRYAPHTFRTTIIAAAPTRREASPLDLW